MGGKPYLVIILLLVLSACTVQQKIEKEIVCDQPYIRFADTCCLDNNGNGICDNDEMKIEQPPLNITSINENKTLANDSSAPSLVNESTSTTNVTNNYSMGEAPAPLSLTENYSAQFRNHVKKNFGYVTDDDQYGAVYVFVQRNFTKYVSQPHGYLFQLDNATHQIVKSTWTFYAGVYSGNMIFREDVRGRLLPVMNYIWEDANGAFGGCFVWAGYFKQENCIKDNTSNTTPIIFTNFSFRRPASPLDYLEKYNGQKPSKIQEDFFYTSNYGGIIHSIDYVYFQNRDDTITKMYIDRHYKIPLQVDELRDNVVINKTEFYYLEVDDYSTNSFYNYFLEQ